MSLFVRDICLGWFFVCRFRSCISYLLHYIFSGIALFIYADEIEINSIANNGCRECRNRVVIVNREPRKGALATAAETMEKRMAVYAIEQEAELTKQLAEVLGVPPEEIDLEELLEKDERKRRERRVARRSKALPLEAAITPADLTKIEAPQPPPRQKKDSVSVALRTRAPCPPEPKLAEARNALSRARGILLGSNEVGPEAAEFKEKIMLAVPESDEIVLPKWLDEYIFHELGASFEPARQEMVVREWSREQLLKYLGTYFPRSFAESYSIFSRYFREGGRNFKNRNMLKILDFGCGTGGETLGLLTAVSEHLPFIKEIELQLLDGNPASLRILEEILEAFRSRHLLRVFSRSTPMNIEDADDLQIVFENIDEKFDIIVAFKSICEFASKGQFGNENPYRVLLEKFVKKVATDGIICLADITARNETQAQWLPVLMDKACAACKTKIVMQNEDYQEIFCVSHSRRGRDTSKLAWRFLRGAGT